MEVFVVRKPVLDRTNRVYGYQLVHADINRPSCTEHTEESTLQLIYDSTLVFGLGMLGSGKKVLISFTADAIAKDCAVLLPKALTIIDLHPSVVPSSEHVEWCRDLRDAGYSIIAPVRAGDEGRNPLLDVASIVSLDLRDWPEHKVTPGDPSLPIFRKPLLVRSVDSPDDFDLAQSLGCTYVEGQYFCKPAILSGGDVPGFRPSYLKLLRTLSDADVNFRALEKIITPEASLTHKLLRLVNSPYYGLRSKVTSVDRALVTLGQYGIRQWVAVIAVSELSGNAPAELIVTSAIRARFCQAVGHAVGMGQRAEELFLMGLFSLLDAIASWPLASLLSDLGVDGPVRDALLGEPNELRPIYDLILAYEHGQWDTVTQLAENIGLQPKDLPHLYLPSVEWANYSLDLAN